MGCQQQQCVCVCQSNIQRDQWAAQWRLVGVFSGGAHVFNRCPQGELCPSLLQLTGATLPSSSSSFHNTNAGGAINNGLTLLLLLAPYLPPAPTSLLCFLSISTVFDVASSFSVIPPDTLMCVIVLDLSWWHSYLAQLVLSQRALFHVPATQALVVKYPRRLILFQCGILQLWFTWFSQYPKVRSVLY